MAEGVAMSAEISPVHLAIIPDGNRRWERELGLPLGEGHRVGALVCERIAQAVFKRGIRHLSIWAISEENVSERREEEVLNLSREVASGVDMWSRSSWAKEYGVCIRVPGLWEVTYTSLGSLEREIELINGAEKRTKNYYDNFLYIYTVNNGNTKIPSISGMPSVDLTICTGLELNELPHFSEDFLKSGYTDNTVFDYETVRGVLWPDFTEEHLQASLDAYKLTQRLRWERKRKSQDKIST